MHDRSRRRSVPDVVAQPFRAAPAADGRPEGLGYERPPRRDGRFCGKPMDPLRAGCGDSGRIETAQRRGPDDRQRRPDRRRPELLGGPGSRMRLCAAGSRRRPDRPRPPRARRAAGRARLRRHPVRNHGPDHRVPRPRGRGALARHAKPRSPMAAAPAARACGCLQHDGASRARIGRVQRAPGRLRSRCRSTGRATAECPRAARCDARGPRRRFGSTVRARVAPLPSRDHRERPCRSGGRGARELRRPSRRRADERVARQPAARLRSQLSRSWIPWSRSPGRWPVFTARG